MVALTMTKARARRASARSVPASGKSVGSVKRARKDTATMSRHRRTALPGTLITSPSRKRNRTDGVLPDAARSKFVSVAVEESVEAVHVDKEEVQCDLLVPSTEASKSSAQLMNAIVIEEDKENNTVVNYQHTPEKPALPASVTKAVDSAAVMVSETAELECRDEGGEDAVQDDDDYEDFDPYLFIKRLPKLADVVPSCRPHLLPKQTRRCPPVTLVLDLDETLVHSTLEQCTDADFSFPVHFNNQMHTVYVRRRPHLEAFMEKVAQMFEIIVFTASQGVYAEQLLNILDPQRRLIRHRIFRDSCVYVEGNYLKDLSILGRDLSKVAIVDNSPQAFGFQVDNGIPIESWFDDKSDSALLFLLPFLETLVGVDDVRPVIAKQFNLRERIAAAEEPPSLLLR